MRTDYKVFRPSTVLYARELGSYSAASAKAWDRLLSWLDRQPSKHLVRSCFAVLRDCPRLCAPDLLRYDACIGICGDLEADPDVDVRVQMLNGGAYSVHTHVGPHYEIASKLARLSSDHVPRQGLKVDYDRPFMTHFLNDPRMTAQPHRRTELCVPVVPLRMSAFANDAGHLDAVADAPVSMRA